ncbi:MAG: hypothetical protein Q9227_007183 [Pyrenula ochraceoflavens]
MSSTDTNANEIKTYGFTPLPASPSSFLPSPPKTPTPQPPSTTPLPTTPLAKHIHDFARTNLPRPTLHHSLRVYHYGLAIASDHFPAAHQFPADTPLRETYFFACLLHDLGTAPANQTATHLSFEYYGGQLSFRELTSAGAPKAQAESVLEAILRHQDVECEKGFKTLVTALIQIATILDNVGKFGELVSRETIEAVVKEYPREGWSGCFAETLRKENEVKGWCNSSRLGAEDFPRAVEGNELMAKYD